MDELLLPEPFSGGLILSYKCNSHCRHCMYACSPRFKGDWISERDAERILVQLADKVRESPLGPDKIGVNYGLHFTGGEPFLNFDLLLKVTEMARRLRIPSTFVETNSFWCINDDVTRDKLTELRDAGLHGILVSVNPFLLEYVPFERTERAVRIGGEVFGENVIVYQTFFYHQFKRLGFRGSLLFDEYLRTASIEGLSYVELLPMGRACYRLGDLYRKYPAERFFGESCRAELTRPWHIHIDNYGNYIAGYCGGISLGDARDLSSLRKVDLSDRPVLRALVTDLRRLYELGVEEFGYKERKAGYISKCHLCVDVRRHIAQQTDMFKELSPREFYLHLDGE